MLNGNPNRLMIFTNHPEESPPASDPPWVLATIFVMKFYPGLNPDLLRPKLYGLFFWRPEPEKQPNLI